MDKPYKKAVLANKTLSEMNNWLEGPGKWTYRQSVNRITKGWNTPKLRLGNGAFRAVNPKNVGAKSVIIHKFRGLQFAIWRMSEFLDKSKYPDGAKKYQVSDIYYVKTKKYTYYFLYAKALATEKVAGA
jgi:hypothetical protein